MVKIEAQQVTLAGNTLNASSYSEIQNEKYCLLKSRSGDSATNTLGTFDTIVEETDGQVSGEVLDDAALQDQSVMTAGESEMLSNTQVEI